MATKTTVQTAVTISNLKAMSFTRTGTGAVVECNLAVDALDLQEAVLSDVLPVAADRVALLGLLDTILQNMQSAAGYV